MRGCLAGFYGLLTTVLIVVGPGIPSAAGAGFPWKSYASQSPEWFRSEEGRTITANLLSNQSDQGSWPKNFDTSKQPHKGDRTRIEGTFDNGATLGELRFLARAFQATGEGRLR